ncbi:cell wall-binding repeat-containing protein [Buchananella hordeovulneris]|uniref:cell wall-binding repeat-containing protein n=1 Tax=Buchananella hordeovulneris TaxID=52770 RepID=UPI0026DD23C2|nr:cell wall-binding repeat-containing protein [Buchananella hordeovulneris]MDO5079779.1 cell wall-binding repeat-containing protein [Buchananella hordeovulneris]
MLGRKYLTILPVLALFPGLVSPAVAHSAPGAISATVTANSFSPVLQGDEWQVDGESLLQLLAPDALGASPGAGERASGQLTGEVSLPPLTARGWRLQPQTWAAYRLAGEPGVIVEVTGKVADAAGVEGSAAFAFVPAGAAGRRVYGRVEHAGQAIRLAEETPGQVLVTSAPPESTPSAASAPLVPEEEIPATTPLAGSRGAPGESAEAPVADVLIVYSDNIARPKMLQTLPQWVAESNGALEKSGIALRLNLLAIEPVDYRQHQGKEGLYRDIHLLWEGRGSLAKAHALRDAVGADIVVMIVPIAINVGGLSYVPHATGLPDYALAVVPLSTGAHNFLHEVGHTLGTQHDRETAGDNPFPFPYSFGHKVLGVARTVMALDCEEVTPCPSRMQFSNPDIDFLGHPGVPSGTAEANNARSINEMARVITRYRARSLRLEGRSRFDTAVAVSRHLGEQVEQSDTVVLVSAAHLPDAVSAAPLATKLGAPLLYAETKSLPGQTAAELQRLRPRRVIVVGGELAISTQTVTEVSRLVGPAATIERISGSNRYRTSLAVARYGWPAGSNSAFLVSGLDYAGALAAGTAAGRADIPLLLVNGSARSLPSEVSDFLQVGTASGNVYLVGDPTKMSADIEGELQAHKTTVRYAGGTEAEVAAQIAADHDGGGPVVIANGTRLVDALPSAVLAARLNGPLVYATKTCIPAPSQGVLTRHGPRQRILIGGVLSLDEQVQLGATCPGS